MAEPFKNTPPAPEAKGDMTAANIAAALAGESQASQKYLAFADVADAEGYPNVARLFRAVAYAESTHARNHLSVLGGIGTTTENLKAAWGGETFEITEMYPAYDAVAKLQENKSAQTSIRYALTAREGPSGHLRQHAQGRRGQGRPRRRRRARLPDLRPHGHRRRPGRVPRVRHRRLVLQGVLRWTKLSRSASPSRKSSTR